MDLQVRNHLIVLGLERFSDIFTENEIDNESFLQLSEGNLNQLLPNKIGPQLKILAYIRNLNKENQSDLTQQIPRTAEVQFIGGNSSNVENFVCFICTKWFFDVTLLWKHLIHVHSINANCHMFNCVKCKSQFTKLQSYKRHITNCRIIVQNVNSHTTFETEQSNEVENIICSEPDPLNNCENSTNIRNVVAFLCSLQSSGNIPLNVTKTVVDNMQHLISNTVSQIFSTINNYCDPELALKIVTDIKEQKLDLPFNPVATQYKLEKYLQNEGYLLEYKEIILNHDQIWVSTQSALQKQTYDYLYYVSIKSTLLKLLEKDELFKEIQQCNKRKPENGLRSHYRDGMYWESHLKEPNSLYINILVFNDDLEICNPLGSSKGVHKLNITYFQVLEFPTHLNSQLDYIFLNSITKTNNAKKYGFNLLQHYLIEELKELQENGFILRNENFEGKCFVLLSQLTGDNLGIQSVLGFSEVFIANKFCRWCEMTREDTHHEVRENTALIRTKESYNLNLQINDFSKTGIQFDSIFNSLNYYHVVDNKCPDIMHDILEGVAFHNFRLFFKHMMDQGVNLQTIQRLIFSYKFPFGNKSKPTVNVSFLNGGTSALTAAQSLHLLYSIPLIFGHLIEEKDKYLKLTNMLIEIVQIVLSPIISNTGHTYLQNVIERYLTLYVKLSGLTLKPKHHNLLHYSRAIVSLGPLKPFWAMRFEAKHRLAKSIMKVSSNFCNVPKTVVKRFMLSLAQFLLSPVKPELSIKKSFVCSVKSLQNFDLLISLGYKIEDKIICISSLEFRGNLFQSNSILIDSYAENGPKFIKIIHMILHEDETTIIYRELNTTTWCNHYHAYIVENTNVINSKNLVNCTYHYALSESNVVFEEGVDPAIQSYIVPASCPINNLQSKRAKLNLPDVYKIVVENFPSLIKDGYIVPISIAQQNSVLRILVGHLVQHCGYYPGFEVQEEYAEQIATYIPTVIKSALFNRVPGRVISGYIPERLKYIRPLEAKKRRKTPSAAERVSTASVPDPSEDEETIKQQLKFSHFSEAELKHLMAKTFSLRRKEIDNSEGNLALFLQDWPRLTDSDGLVDIDFGRLYPSSPNFQTSWETISIKIHEYARQRNVHWRKLFGITKENVDKDDLEIAAILLLPHLIQGGYKIHVNDNGKKNSKKVSALDSRHHFVQILKVGGSIEEFITYEGLQTQPLVISIGNLQELLFVQNFFVIERRCVLAKSFLKAVDLCMKSFFLFHIRFPLECKQVWNFLGNAVYGLVAEKELTCTAKALKDFCR